MTVKTITTQTITFGADVGLSFGRWDGSVTARDASGDSVTLKTSPEALASAVKSYISGARYVSEDDAPEMVACLSVLVETATDTIRALHERYESLEEKIAASC